MFRKSVMLNAKDSVAVLLEDSKKGDWITTLNGPVELLEDMECSHKVLLMGLRKDEPVIKYGESIGLAAGDIQLGACVHVHNIESQRGRGDRAGKEA